MLYIDHLFFIKFTSLQKLPHMWYYQVSRHVDKNPNHTDFIENVLVYEPC